MAIYKADAVAKALIEAGIFPHNTRRVVVDATANEPLLIYYECYAEEKHVAALSADNLADADPVKVPSIAEAMAPGRLDLHYLLRTLHEVNRRLESMEFKLRHATDAMFKDA